MNSKYLQNLVTSGSALRTVPITEFTYSESNDPADFVCIPTLNSRHSPDGGSVRGVRDNRTEGIMHAMFARITRFRIRDDSNILEPDNTIQYNIQYKFYLHHQHIRIYICYI